MVDEDLIGADLEELDVDFSASDPDDLSVGDDAVVVNDDDGDEEESLDSLIEEELEDEELDAFDDKDYF